jgi:Gas vesicle synthesis protein GvpL/GvpF
VIYLYALTDPAVPVPASNGIADLPVRALRTAHLAALYSRSPAGELNPDPQSLWRHDQVVEAAMRHGPALPVRFGTTFEDADALGAVLEREGEGLRRQLDRVRGCVELAVRVQLPGAPQPRPESGHDYVSAKLERRFERRRVAERVLAPLAELAVNARTDVEQGDGDVVRASYLVRTEQVESFVSAVRESQRENGNVLLTCTGPWAPYSFAAAEASP